MMLMASSLCRVDTEGFNRLMIVDFTMAVSTPYSCPVAYIHGDNFVAINLVMKFDCTCPI